MSACRTCGAEVRWVFLEPKGSRAPLNVHPSATGNIILLEGGEQARVLNAAELIARKALPGGPGPLYTSHFATCANAAYHRRKK